MKRVFIMTGLGVGLAVGAGAAHGQEIETFDSPNELQTAGGNYHQINDTASFTSGNGAVVTFGSTFYEIGTTTGYGSGFHNIFTDDKPPAGSGLTNGVVDISGSKYLQLDITINKGTDAGPFIDLLDGEGDFWQYSFGFGLTGTNNAPPQSPGEIITQGPGNELIMDIPLADPTKDINGTKTFDFTQLTLFRIENDPGATNNVPNPSDISFNDLSAVNLPEPAALTIGAFGLVLFGKRRARYIGV